MIAASSSAARRRRWSKTRSDTARPRRRRRPVTTRSAGLNSGGEGELEYSGEMKLRYACLIGTSLLLSQPAIGQERFEYRGMCDASAAVALDSDHFVVANDERNTLLIYRRGVADAVDSVPMSKFLGTEEDIESDIEGAAEVAGRIYWITSHGRNSKGKVREQRHRLFATEIVPGTVPPKLKPAGTPYSGLLEDLIKADPLRSYKLEEASKQPPEALGGLNIEGLAATPSGALLIGFRNPVPGGRALIVELENPREVVSGARARLGAPMELDLGGRGIRSLERIGSDYLIVAGPPADKGRFDLYRWSGKRSAVPQRLARVDFGTLRPEAMFEVPGTSTLQILSDDGGIKTHGIACKDRPPTEQSFRSLTLKP
jgi:Protein of unknown function (DUF3616)